MRKRSTYRILISLIIFICFFSYSNLYGQLFRSISQAVGSSSKKSVSAKFSFSPFIIVAGAQVKFSDKSTGSPTGWLWDFGDGTISYEQNPSHVYQNPGAYTISLIANTSSASSKATKKVKVYGSKTSSSSTQSIELVPDFNVSPSTPEVGMAVQFTDSSTGNPASWSWDFGDGSQGSGKNPQHSYQASGALNIKLTISNGAQSKSVTKPINVLALLTPNFSFSPGSPKAGDYIHFQDSSAGNPTSWSWDFGDGSKSTVKNPQYAYRQAGTYAATLSVSNGYYTKSIAKTIVVNPVIQADFGYSPTNPVVGTSIQFSDKSSGNITTWSWKFGDSGTSTVKNPTHVYSTAGTYNVTLTVSDGASSNSMTQTVTVTTPVVADFSFDPASPVVNQQVQFLDGTQGTPTSWSWDFGDAATSTSKNPTHTYSQAGTYTVKLTASDGTNSSAKNKSLTVSSSSSSKVITATSCALIDVQAAIATAKAGDTVLVPAGKVTWSSNLVINKGIILRGMGIDKTVISCSYAGTGQITSPGGYFITYEPSSPSEDQSFRLTGFTFNLNSITNTGGLLLRNVTSYHQTKIRIDHTKWQNVVDNGTIIWVYGYFWGVADNNYFDTPGRFRFYALDTTTWANETFSFGSANNFYMEDNYFRCYKGDYWYIEGAGRVAIRHNEIHLDVRDDYYPVVDVHGNQSSAWSSAMGSEVYNNTIYFSYSHRIVDMRCGKNLFYNNSLIRTAGSSMLCSREEEPDSNNPPGFAPDGQPQHVSDSYIFRNYLDNNLILNNSCFPYIGGQLYYSELGRNVPMEDKDFWKHAQNFDGSTGVGVGINSARPAYCKTEGVAYWVTDENILYRWHNGKWELYYVPYIYPHPLRTILGE